MLKKFLILIKYPIFKFTYYFLHPIRKISDILLNNQLKKFLINPKNPLNKYGKRCFSQCDEDGITLEIIRRLKVDVGTFLEIGSGNGLQNNTLILSALGWKGIWADIKDVIIDIKNLKKLIYFKKYVTEENIVELIKQGLNKLNENELDCISIDIDGEDYYIVNKILEEKINPKFFIVEINQRFPPPVEFVVEKNKTYDFDYFGASLTSFNKLFNKYGYSLICISSILGHNAFFLKDEFLEYFKEVPKDISDIYITPNYWSFSHNFKTSLSPKVVENIFKDKN